MKLQLHCTSIIAALGLFAVLLVPVRAATYTEQGDAGDLLGTAQLATGTPLTSLTAINGTISLTNGISDGDMFQIYINSPSTFSASTTAFVPGANNFDTQLFLFNSSGIGVVTNDDDPGGSGAQSNIPAGNGFVITPGTYYLLIDGSGRYPVNMVNQLSFPNFTDNTTDPTGVYGPTGPGGSDPLAGYTGNSSEGGNYSIALTGVIIVPEPSTVAAGLITAAGLIITEWRRRRAARPISAKLSA
jgi:hypothetical protein